MKPFDLEAAKRGEPIQTRDGSPARLIAHVPEAKECMRLIVLVQERVHTMHANGRYSLGDEKYALDLFMAPKKRTVWINLYTQLSSTDNFGYFYRSEDDADGAAAPGRIGGKAYPVEIEE